ncbi:protein of unknown function [Acidithiobacillus ferrivorans]|uniref:Uncharacterized protein n=1 Tax=Acidithiobacillus ferrivorans TaxID=160808 RepID=A0A060UVJ9_9PROT|nr:hypothetical protein [Acidithiobacillus ferrivorans]CDQ10569.1 hypothetical protein AFERRI_400350 [Acidithiobacillus ferrivorans]SMH64600.1 protein of unknown function [Acidithiobacillus ferrivorans]
MNQVASDSRKPIQHRGHCQCCAREQAVIHTGNMAHHGYTVKNGWFDGVCQGHQCAPIERDHEVADRIIADVRKQLTDLCAQVVRLRKGEVFPEFIETYHDGLEKIRIPYADATPYQQQEGVNRLLFSIEGRIRVGESFLKMLERAISLYHGKPLMEVTKQDAPKPILTGEIRVSQRGRLQVKTVTGGSVRWIDERGFIGRSSTRAWRQMQTETQAEKRSEP